jgi:hypothetical protein
MIKVLTACKNCAGLRNIYLHYDNLGSIDTITDGQGNIVERMSYAAFGERRKGDWRASDPLPITAATTTLAYFLIPLQRPRHALAIALKGFHR